MKLRDHKQRAFCYLLLLATFARGQHNSTWLVPLFPWLSASLHLTAERSQLSRWHSTVFHRHNQAPTHDNFLTFPDLSQYLRNFNVNSAVHYSFNDKFSGLIAIFNCQQVPAVWCGLRDCVPRVTTPHIRVVIFCGIDCFHCLDIKHVFGAPTMKQSNFISLPELPNQHRDFKYVAIPDVPDSLSYLPSDLPGPLQLQQCAALLHKP